VTSPQQLRRVDLACLAVVTSWGVNFAIMKRSLQRFDTPVFNVIRFTIMVVLGWSLHLIAVRSGRAPRWPQRADWARVALAGGVGFFGYLYGFTLGLDRTSAFSSSLLTAMSSLFVALLLWGTKAERLGTRQVLALMLAATGAVVFVVGRSNGQIAISSGDSFALGAAFLYALYLVTNRPLTTKYPAMSLTTWSLTVAWVVVVMIGAPALPGQDWSAVDTSAWLSMAWAATIPVFVAWTVWAWANGQAGVARPSLWLVLVPVISGAFAWWYLDEDVRVLQLIGMAIVLSALLIGRTAPPAKAPEE
jgi:drug/metabolite transporter (DMT)-like permease